MHAQAVIAAGNRLQRVINPAQNPSPMRLQAKKVPIWDTEQKPPSSKLNNIELPPIKKKMNKKEYFMQRAGMLPNPVSEMETPLPGKYDRKVSQDKALAERHEDLRDSMNDQSHEANQMNNLNVELESIVDSVVQTGTGFERPRHDDDTADARPSSFDHSPEFPPEANYEEADNEQTPERTGESTYAEEDL